MSVHFHSFLKTTLCRAVARFLIVVLVVADVPTNLGAADAPAIRYVSNTDPTCQGHAPCYPTIQAGVTALQAGETLLIQAGTYDETVTIANKNNNAGASEADRMFILADPSASVGSVVLGSRRAGKCIGGTNVVHIQDSQFLTLRGLTIRDASQWALDLAGGKNIRSRAIHLERNRILNDAALKCRGGIQIGAENTETVLSNNLIYGNREEGIVFKQGIRGLSGPHFLLSNTIHGNGRTGIHISEGQEVWLVNNLITGNGTKPVSPTKDGFGVERRAAKPPDPVDSTVLLSNLICGNSTGEIKGPVLVGTDAGNLTPTGSEGPGVSASPGCQAPASIYANLKGPDGQLNTADDDFTLAAGSPAIDRGVELRTFDFGVPASVVEADYFAEASRPQDGDTSGTAEFDLGAVERGQSGCTSGTTQSCYDGSEGTAGVGVCRAGTRMCQPDGTFGACEGQVLPGAEGCGNATDEDCDGQVEDPEVCTAQCTPGGACDTGVPGICAQGQITCPNGPTGAPVCTQTVTPTPEVCGNATDEDCDGQVEDPEVCTAQCTPGGACDTGVPGICGQGQITCPAGPAGDPVCTQTITLGVEVCGNATDEDCDGQSNDPDVCTASNTPPQIISTPLTTSMVGQQYSYDVEATDPDTSDTLTFSLPLGPAGMTINAGSGLIEWTPEAGQDGQHDVTVQVADGQGGLDSQTLIITVGPVNTAPTANNDAYEARMRETLNVPAPGVMTNDTDPNNDPLQAMLVQGPTNGTLAFNADGSFQYTPTPLPTPTFQPTLKYRFDQNIASGVRGGPVVADVDANGVPDFVVHSFRAAGFGNNWIQVVRGDTGQQTAEVNVGQQGTPLAADDGVPAIGNLDSDPQLEIVVPADCEGNVIVFEHDLTLKWSSSPGFGQPGCTVDGSNKNPVLADLDGDGTPEILVATDASTSAGAGSGVRVFDAAGNILWEIDGVTNCGTSEEEIAVADIDLDGQPEVVIGDQALVSATGTIEWQVPLFSDCGLPAIANLDDDPFGEIVKAFGGDLTARNHDGTLLWNARNVPGNLPALNDIIGIVVGSTVIDDLDGDGEVDIAVIGDQGSGNRGFLFVFERDGGLKYRRELCIGSTVEPCPGANQTTPDSMTAFDFNRDGIFEIVILTDSGLVVLRGSDGAVVFEQNPTQGPNSAGDMDQQTPLVVDIDGDGRAELVVPDGTASASSGGGQTGVFVYENVNDDWPQTRSIWNQWPYQVTNVLADGTIPAQEQVHWLTPGLNRFRVNVPLPEEREGQTDQFTYKVNDGAFDSNTATVHLDILPPGNPPRILSQPDTTATVGFAYTYRVFATDPDVGDVLTFALSSAPAGMTINSATGAITWTPTDTQAGQHQVGITVSDPQGLTALQAYTLTVGQPVIVPDVVGQPQATAEAAITGANLTVGTVATTTSPTVPAGVIINQSPPGGAVAEFGGAVNLVVSLGPAPGDVDNDGDGFSENEGDCNDGNVSIFPGASDSSGNGIDENCDGADGVLVLEQIVISPTNPIILAGDTQAFTATAVFTNGTSQNFTNVVIWESTNAAVASITTAGVATGLSGGTTTIRATKNGITGSTTLTVSNQVAGDTTPPTAAITAPASNSTITEPVSIMGTATDANFLKYVLAIAPAGETTFTQLAQGTTPVTNGALGAFDPTLLINDLYTVRLTVFDQGGNETIAEAVYQVDRDQKVGLFTVTFQDLNVAVSGLPITINRTYDSRDKRKGDFGVGWRLDVQTLRLRTNRVLGTGWQVVKSGLSFALTPTDAHKVSLTLADSTVEEFDLVISPTVSPLVPFPPSTLTASFQARPGTVGKLQSLENNILTILDPQPGVVELLNDTTFNPYNPQTFRYTALDGTEFVIHKTAGVQSVKELNGNTLTFGPTGIIHSAGKSVTFVRDAQNRITQITDPSGNSQSYAYNAAGDLISHTKLDCRRLVHCVTPCSWSSARRSIAGLLRNAP